MLYVSLRILAHFGEMLKKLRKCEIIEKIKKKKIILKKMW